MYSFVTDDGKEKKRAKGIVKANVKQIRHQEYLGCLQDHSCTEASMHSFRSNDHRIFTNLITKVGLSAYDDKRYVLPDGIQTLAYGHHTIISAST
jgi:hypothetical protein